MDFSHWIRAGLGAMALLIAPPAFAETDGFALAPDRCLIASDAAFEHSLTDGLAEADRIALVTLFETATYECLRQTLEICEGQDDAVGCLSDLAAWAREERALIAARLPEAIDYDNAFTAGRYLRHLEVALGSANEAACGNLSEAHQTRYCEVFSEGSALESAYDAWRMARSEGVVPLEGHDPINLEWIR